MARFNQSVSPAQKVVNRPDATPNLAGGLSFRVDPEMELYLRACAGLLQDRYYDKASDQLAGVKNLIPKCDPEFVLKLATYVRNDMLLRSMPVVLLAEVSRHPDLPPGMIRKYVPRIIQRADEPGELLSYWMQMNGSKKKMSMGLRKGLNDTLPKFSEYNLQKYNRDGNVKLRDVLRIAHPKPLDEKMSDLWKRTIADELATPETWEVEISTKGSTAENWNEIAPKMGFMALLRNLRNFVQKGADKAIEIAIKKLTDPDEVERSKQLPFRFWSAYKALGGNITPRSYWWGGSETTVPKNDRLLDAVITALDLSLDNVEPFDGSTAIFVDLSGSMDSKLSDKSDTSYKEVASLMGAMARRLSKGETYVGGFADNFAWVSLSKHDSVMTNMKKIIGTDVGSSTLAYKCIQALLRGIDVDRVLLFSDMQCYGETQYGWWGTGEQLAPLWKKYQTTHPKSVLYSFDLASYGEPQFPQDETKVFQLSGFSEKVLDFIKYTEDSKVVLEKIRAIEV
jgi:60 kDa SS-A/Ro ribonucleoprotein